LVLTNLCFLWATPARFSHEGPTQAMMEQTSFSMTFFAEGYSNKRLLTGPAEAKKDPAPDYKVSLLTMHVCLLPHALWLEVFTWCNGSSRS
jgi:hypothetical protein